MVRCTRLVALVFSIRVQSTELSIENINLRTVLLKTQALALTSDEDPSLETSNSVYIVLDSEKSFAFLYF